MKKLKYKKSLANLIHNLIFDKLEKAEISQEYYRNGFSGTHEKLKFRRLLPNDTYKYRWLVSHPRNPACFLLHCLSKELGNKSYTLEDFKFHLDLCRSSGGKKYLIIKKYYGLYEALKEVIK